MAHARSDRKGNPLITRRLVVGVALASTLTAATAIPASGATVRGSGTRWRPASVDIDRGDRVRWRAVSATHTVRAYGGNWTFSERLSAGESASRRFRQRGTYRFFCSIHGDVIAGNCTGMCGRVRV
jgi:plastocyanin